MSLFDSDDGLILKKEGLNVRARSGTLNYLFVNRSEESVLRDYKSAVSFVRRYFEPRFELIGGENISEDDFFNLTQKITLDWMYYYIINRLPVHITDNDLKHVHTNDDVWSFFKNKFGESNPLVTQLSGIFLGKTEAEFNRWLDGWKKYLDR